MDVDRDDAGGGTGSARRRRKRRLRSFLRHERRDAPVRVQPPHGEVLEAPLPQGGSRPPCLGVPRGPQVGLERHFLEHMADVCPFVRIVDALVPQTVDDVTDVLRFLDFPTAEQVIEVPKISCSPCPSRSLVPEPVSAEQLVEVPTVLSPTRIALRIAEQIVDTPVPHGTTATHSSGKRISERTVEQIVDFPSSGGGLGTGFGLICWCCR